MKLKKNVAAKPVRSLVLSVMVIGCALTSIDGYAEIQIPNPLIKPAQISPIAAGEGKGGGNQGLPGEVGSLPALPSPSSFDSKSKSTDVVKDADSVRLALTSYQVVFLNGDHAVLKNASSTSSPVAGGSEPNSQGTVSLRKTNTQTLYVRKDGYAKFMGEILKVNIDGDTVELYKLPKGVAKLGRASVEGDIVFVGAFEPSSIPAYVPDLAKMEKPDSTYQKSLEPDTMRSSGNSSNGSNSSSNGQSNSSQNSGSTVTQ